MEEEEVVVVVGIGEVGIRSNNVATNEVHHVIAVATIAS